MSLFSVRALLRERMEGLGFSEHDQPFQPTQIGNTIINDSFHLETGLISSAAAAQRVHSFEFPVTIRVYKRGFLNLLEAYDDIHMTADEILSDLLEPSVRIGTDIKDLIPDSIQIAELDDSNDNVLMLELGMTALLELCFVT